MRNLQNLPPATPETAWAQIQESNRLLMERQAETDRLLKENERLIKESNAKFEENWKKYERRVKLLEKSTGSWAYNFGSFAEEYFYNSFVNEQQNFFGEHFNEIRSNLKYVGKNHEDEYDIVMYNDISVAIVEVKYKAHENDVPSVLKKAETFRMFFPDYKDYKIYLGLASLSFYSELEQECINQGIAVIKQVGDTVVINDTNLKIF